MARSPFNRTDPSKLPPVIIATRNPHKLEEIQAIFADLPVQLLSLADFPEIGDIPETGQTFAENALQKARTVFHQTGLLTLADDSGLEVDALNGAPGIYSARFAGPRRSTADNNRKLQALIKAVPPEKRTARFKCAVALVGPNLEAVVEGVVEGHITTKPRGTGGFGYDPLFIPAGYEQTFAQLGSEVKNRISHRARAFQKARVILKKQLEFSNGGTV